MAVYFLAPSGMNEKVIQVSRHARDAGPEMTANDQTVVTNRTVGQIEACNQGTVKSLFLNPFLTGQNKKF